MRYFFPVALLILLTLAACDTTDDPEGFSLSVRLRGTEGLPVTCTIALSNNLGEATETFSRMVPDEAALSPAEVVFASCDKEENEGELILELLLESQVVDSSATTEPFGRVSVVFP